MSQIRLDTSAAQRLPSPSACPSLFRIVAARDGGICRVKLPFGHLTPAQASTVAAAAGRFGSGVIEITNRANLQIRGIRPAADTALADALIESGLGPSRPEADDIRNIMVSPTAGIDPQQQIDALPLASELLHRIERDARFQALSPKFSFLIDGGESVAAIDRTHDIWLAAMGGGTMALGIDGSPPVGGGEDTPVVRVMAGRVVEAAVAATLLFLEVSAGNPEIARCRDLLPFLSRLEFLNRLADRLGLRCERTLWRRSPWRHPRPLGVYEQRQAGLVFVGAAPPLARLSAEMLEALAGIAERSEDRIIRLTPWHGVVVPSIRRAEGTDLLLALDGTGFVTDTHDPHASVVACAGSAGCISGRADAKADAASLARALGRQSGAGKTVHVSGCAKGCALPGMADATLIASSAGSYSLYVEDGSTSFGRCIADDMDIAQIAAWLRQELA